jgi:hypothetical protein
MRTKNVVLYQFKSYNKYCLTRGCLITARLRQAQADNTFCAEFIKLYTLKYLTIPK